MSEVPVNTVLSFPDGSDIKNLPALQEIQVRCRFGITDSMDISLKTLRGVGDGQGSLACCSPWGRKESDMTE